MTSDIALSARPKVSGRLVDWHIPVPSRRPASQLPILQLQLVRSHSPILQVNTPVRASYDPAASNQSRATQSRRMRHVLRPRGKSPGSSRRVIHLRLLGHS